MLVRNENFLFLCLSSGCHGWPTFLGAKNLRYGALKIISCETKLRSAIFSSEMEVLMDSRVHECYFEGRLREISLEKFATTW